MPCKLLNCTDDVAENLRARSAAGLRSCARRSGPSSSTKPTSSTCGHSLPALRCSGSPRASALVSACALLASSSKGVIVFARTQPAQTLSPVHNSRHRPGRHVVSAARARLAPTLSAAKTHVCTCYWVHAHCRQHRTAATAYRSNSCVRSRAAATAHSLSLSVWPCGPPQDEAPCAGEEAGRGRVRNGGGVRAARGPRGGEAPQAGAVRGRNGGQRLLAGGRPYRPSAPPVSADPDPRLRTPCEGPLSTPSIIVQHPDAAWLTVSLRVSICGRVMKPLRIRIGVINCAHARLESPATRAARVQTPVQQLRCQPDSWLHLCKFGSRAARPLGATTRAGNTADICCSLSACHCHHPDSVIEHGSFTAAAVPPPAQVHRGGEGPGVPHHPERRGCADEVAVHGSGAKPTHCWQRHMRVSACTKRHTACGYTCS